MVRFAAIVWIPDSEAQVGQAARMRARLTDSHLVPIFYADGIAVYGQVRGDGADSVILLAESRGVILGQIFKGGTDYCAASTEITELGDSETTEIIGSEGRVLTDNYWGCYVAFLHNRPSRFYVMQDPCAGLTLFRGKVEDVAIYFSDLQDFALMSENCIAVNWDYLCANAVIPGWRCEATGLRGVYELQGGQCDIIWSGRHITEKYWTPAKFVSLRQEDEPDAARMLRLAVGDAVGMLLKNRRGVLHQLSGGVDSSIVLSCIQKLPVLARTTCVTDFSDSAGHDERGYACLSAEAAQCRWLGLAADKSLRLDAVLDVEVNPRPDLILSHARQRDVLQMARRLGATAISSGMAGDAVFGEIADTRIAVDFLKNHGIRGGVLPTLMNIARVAGSSLGHTTRVALKGWVSRSGETNPWAEAIRHRTLLSDHAREFSKREEFIHPWIRDAAGVPPGKRIQIAMMAQPATVRPALRDTTDVDYVHPLSMRRVMEIGAAVPSYALVAEGQTRRIARVAFQNDVPAKILARRSKGTPENYVRHVMAGNWQYVRERLLDGKLIPAGILDRSRVEAAMDGRSANVGVAELMFHLSTEIWLERMGDLRSNIATGSKTVSTSHAHAATG